MGPGGAQRGAAGTTVLRSIWQWKHGTQNNSSDTSDKAPRASPQRGSMESGSNRVLHFAPTCLPASFCDQSEITDPLFYVAPVGPHVRQLQV